MVVALTEIVPASVRTAGFSLAYSLARALFGGFTAAISTERISLTGDKAARGLWMTFAAVCGPQRRGESQRGGRGSVTSRELAPDPVHPGLGGVSAPADLLRAVHAGEVSRLRERVGLLRQIDPKVLDLEGYVVENRPLGAGPTAYP
jgi:hypothetical protein